jgi:poly-gamma-glutamate capsule biosynthesis protein CapA/YwtB (metallophosphatase superfamily)
MRRSPSLACAALAVLLLAGACAPPAAMESTASPSGSIRLALLGQALVEHDARRWLPAPMATLAPILDRADVVFTNFESAVKGSGCICAPTRGGVYQHGGGPEALDLLRAARVRLLALSNNHSWDFGTDGVLSTLDETRARSFVTAGTGPTMAAASAPAYLTVRGVTLALVSMATVRISDSAAATASRAGVNLLRLENATDWSRNLEAIHEARRHADVVLVYHHCQTICTPEWQRSWAHAAIDAGGSLYVSHGEPTLAGVERYRGRPVLYDLGNFIFQTKTPPGRYTSDVWESVVAELSIGRDTVSELRFTPIVLAEGVAGDHFLETRGFPELADSVRGRAILERLEALSAKQGTVLVMERGVAVMR